jgi:energy-coupling factor transporter ATP-binding protein EcfA2
MAAFIIAQTLFELLALLFTTKATRQYLYSVTGGSFISIITIVLIGTTAYLVIAFLSIRSERRAVLGLVNDLRGRLFSGILGREERSVTHEAKADFIAKVSYHLPTLSLGVDHSLFGCIRWALSACVIVALALVAGPKALILALIVIAGSVAVAGIAYVVAMRYVSQEVTAYSQIMRHISLTLAEFPSIKKLHLQPQAMKDLESRVTTDTHLRVRRDVWIRYVNRLVFAGMFVAGVSLSAFALSYPQIVSTYSGSTSAILTAAFALYALRLVYQAVQAGLYLPPLRLGLFLSVPRGPAMTFGPVTRGAWNTIVFRSNKTRLFPEGAYLKDVSISIRKGERHLFVGGPSSGKTSLAFLFGDKPLFNAMGWIAIEDGRRLSAVSWANETRQRYLFGPQFRSEKTLGELMLGKSRQDIDQGDIERLYALSERHPAFFKIFAKKRFVGESAQAFENNPSALFAIQALHCLLNDMRLIVIDNAWVDLGYEEIDETIRTLSEELPDSVIIMFARKERNMLKEQISHEIKQGQIL